MPRKSKAPKTETELLIAAQRKTLASAQRQSKRYHERAEKAQRSALYCERKVNECERTLALLVERAQQEAAIEQLCRWGSHAALAPEDAAKIEPAFPGFKIHFWTERANVRPKGLINPALKKGQRVKITGAWAVAASLAAHVGAEYEGADGRGTKFRNAIAAIREKLGFAAPSVTA